jgi:hypothetical protein
VFLFLLLLFSPPFQVATSICDTGAGPAVTSQQCNTQNCTMSYLWKEGAWSTCSVSCGGGTQTVREKKFCLGVRHGARVL